MEFGTAHMTFAIVAAGGEPPEWVHLLPSGTFTTNDGRGPFHLRDAETLLRAAGGRDLVLDFEHQTDNAPRNGQPAPAAGWIKELAARADGIWGRVEWTERAAGMIRDKEYRFLSPVFQFSRATKAVTRLLRAALTNNPALEDLTALARKENDMDLIAKLREILLLEADADEDAVIARLKEREADHSLAGDSFSSIRKALGLKGDTKAADVVAAVEAAAGDAAIAKATREALALPDDADAKAVETALAKKGDGGTKDSGTSVSREEFDKVNRQLGEVLGAQATERATAKVEAAVKEGKIVPAQREWAIGFAAKDPDGFNAFVSKQPVVLAPGAAGAAAPAKKGAALSDDEKAVCRAMGLDEAAFRKTRDEDLEEGDAA
jgi:phage I-like protein